MIIKLLDTHFHPQLINAGSHSHYFTNDVHKAIGVSVCLDDRYVLYRLSREHMYLYYSVGSHPLSYENVADITLCPTLYDNRMVAIGETGLDYHLEVSAEDKRQQRIALTQHLHLARKLNKPVIIHSRYDVTEDLLYALGLYPDVTGVLHCFNGTIECARRALTLGYYISFAGILTFKNAVDLRLLARYIPLNRILIETDAPYLSPHPLRGQPNHPSNLHITAQFLAKTLGKEYDDIARITWMNSHKLFKIPPLYE